MKLSLIITRTILGIIFFVGGVLASRNLLSDFKLFDNPYLVQTLIALLSGIFGVFAVPFLVEKVRRWFESLITATVAKSLAPWTKQVSRQVGKQIGKAVASRRKPKPPVPPTSPVPSVILDTSVIIDGRLLDILKTSFLDAPLIVPQFVLDELQRIADSSDDLRRQRGRRGLEILDEMKKDKETSLTVEEFTLSPEGEGKGEGVDKKLILMAKKLRAKIATVDFNLNKAASVSGIKILNVNELANSVKTVVLPGEKLKIKVTQKGKEEGQGVGYLEDGTMVVVENGESLLGQQVEVEVSRILQTAAGRMVFATSPY